MSQPLILDTTNASRASLDPNAPVSASQPAISYRVADEIVRRRNTNQDDVFFATLRRNAQLAEQQQGDAAVTVAVDAMRRRVLALLINVLNRRGVDTTHIDVRSAQWILPTTQEHGEIWQLLFVHTLHVPPELVSEVLETRLSTANSPPPANDKSVTFYVRTLPFRVFELIHVLSEMDREGYIFQKAKDWVVELEGLHPLAIKYIRFAGKCVGKTAYQRAQGDLYYFSGSYALTFMQIAATLYPNVVDNAVIHEFPKAFIDGPAQGAVADVREQLLIALFDNGSVNTQIGGEGAVWRPTGADQMVFLPLQTNVMAQYATATVPLPQNLVDRIHRYAAEMTDYANEHPYISGTVDNAFTARIEQVIIEQALSCLMPNGFTPLCFVGAHLPAEHSVAPRGFWVQDGRSMELARNVINALASWEQPIGVLNPTYALTLAAAHQLPFVDFYPGWKTMASEIEDSARLFRTYLNIVNPLILTVYGDEAFTQAMDNFQGTQARRTLGDFWQRLGKVYLVRYHEPGRPRSNDLVVLIIPSYHTGAPGYCSGAANAMSRVILLTHMISWLAISEAYKHRNSNASKYNICMAIKRAVESMTGEGTAFGVEFERAVRTMLHLMRNHRRVARLGATATAARARSVQRVQDLIQARNDRGYDIRVSQMLSASDQSLAEMAKLIRVGEELRVKSRYHVWQQALDELVYLTERGVALGQPNSNERITCLVRLRDSGSWVHVTNATGRTEQEYRDWAASQPTNTFLFLQSARLKKLKEEIPHLLSVMAWSTDVNTDWVSDKLANPTMITAAKNALISWSRPLLAQSTAVDVMQVLQQGFFELRERKDAVAHAAMKTIVVRQTLTDQVFDIRANLNGTQIQLNQYREGSNQKCLIRHGIRWTAGGRTYNMDSLIFDKTIMPRVATDTRHIHFVAAGLDIRNAAGRSLGVSVGSTVTTPINQLIVMLSQNPFRDAFLTLWERQSGNTVAAALQAAEAAINNPNAVLATNPDVIPRSFFAGRQANMTVQERYGAHERTTYNALRPFQPGDIQYLFHHFFLLYYAPQGNALIDCDTNRRSQRPNDPNLGDSVWYRLLEFCADPKWSRHPHIDTLRAFAMKAAAAPASTPDIRNTNAQLFFMAEYLRPVPAGQNQWRQANGRRILRLGPVPANTVVATPIPALVNPDEEDYLQAVRDADLQAFQAWQAQNIGGVPTGVAPSGALEDSFVNDVQSDEEGPEIPDAPDSDDEDDDSDGEPSQKRARIFDMRADVIEPHVRLMDDFLADESDMPERPIAEVLDAFEQSLRNFLGVEDTDEARDITALINDWDSGDWARFYQACRTFRIG